MPRRRKGWTHHTCTQNFSCPSDQKPSYATIEHEEMLVDLDAGK
jgi:hypothetical protein